MVILMVLYEVVDNIDSLFKPIVQLIILFQINIFLDLVENLIFEVLVIDEDTNIVQSMNQ